MSTQEACNLIQCTPQYYFKKALSYFETQQLSSALQSLDAAIIFSHNSPFYIYQKIRFLYELGDLKNCHLLIVSQLGYLYKHASLYLVCRSIDYLQRINEYDLSYLERLLKHYNVPYCLASSYQKLLTEKHKPFLQLARKAMIQDQYPLCISYCKLYLKLYPKCLEICYMMAYSHHMLGHLIEAKNSYLDTLNFNSRDAKACVDMAFINMELGDYYHASGYLRKATDLEPSNIEYLSYLGESYYVSKKFEEAISTYERILALKPDDLQCHFDLLHIYTKLSRKRLVKRYLRSIQKLVKVKGGKNNE